MPKEKMKTLMSELHELFGNEETSPQQAQLMRDLDNHIHKPGEPDTPDPGMVESLEYLVEDMEAEHPRSAAVLREILATLRNIGV